MERTPIPTWYFVLVVVRLENRFLLIQERKHNQLWYLPAGRVEPGETFIKAAQREALEESGIPVTIDGIVRIEHLPNLHGMTRMRVIFTAKPQDNTPPKKHPDEHSLKAAWVTLTEMESLPLRGNEVLELFHYIANDGPIYPLKMLTREGAPFI
jgi:8-oxo-dGTP pyrophosphatase MutT (NUDIX family)